MGRTHPVVADGPVLPVGEQLRLAHQPAVGAGCLGREQRRVVLGALPVAVECRADLAGLAFEIRKVAALAEEAVEFLQLGQGLGGRELKQVDLHGCLQGIVAHAVRDPDIGIPDAVGFRLNGLQKVFGEESKELRIERGLRGGHASHQPLVERVTVLHPHEGCAIDRPALRGCDEKIPKAVP